MKPLEYFTESSGIFPGRNLPVFAKLEYLINVSKKSSAVLPPIGMFGSASVGKTTTAKLLADYSNHTFIYINCAELSKMDDLISTSLSYSAYSDTYTGPDGKKIYFSNSPVLILLDEAHKLPSKMQTSFLTLLDPNELSGVYSGKSTSINYACTGFVFATTNKSSLCSPLVSRLVSCNFISYAVYDIGKIISMSHTLFSDYVLQILAKCSKLLPRVALQYADMLYQIYGDNPSDEDMADFLGGYLIMTSEGLDSIDIQILDLLKSSTSTLSQSDLSDKILCENILNHLSLKAELSESEQHKKINAESILQALRAKKTTYAPKSCLDIMIACNTIDKQNMMERISYLVELNKVKKTTKGIIYNDS